MGDLHPGETAFTITDLNPGLRYIIRVVATNASNYSAVSDTIRICTESAGQTESSRDVNTGAQPSIIPCKGFGELSAANPVPPVIHREHSGSFSKRGNTIRRNSPATSFEPQASETQVHSPDSVYELTAKLESTRKELEDMDRQEEEEEREFHAAQREWFEKRESLRQQLKKRDDESSELRRTVTTLEREFTAAQSKKSKQEKVLNQLKAERDRVTEDTERWEREVPSFVDDAKRYIEQKAQNEEDAQEKIQVIRQEGEQDQTAMKAIEEQIRVTGIRLKELEEEKAALEELPEDDGLLERQRRAGQEDMEWNQKLSELQHRWHEAWSAMNQAQHVCNMAQQRLEFLSARHNSQLPPTYEQSNPSNVTEMTRTDSQQQAGYQSSPAPSSNGLPEPRLRHPSLQLRKQSNNSPAAIALTPFFNTASMLQIPIRSSPSEDGMSDNEVGFLTGGALSSPSAGALLPSDLLGDESEEPVETTLLPAPATPYLPGLGAFPEEPNSPENAMDDRPDMASPLSFDDRSPSLMSSAKNSISNFHQQKLSNGGGFDSDRRSIRSVSSSTRAPPRTGFRFGFQRARASSSGENGFPFGSLSNNQSRSLSHAEEEPTEPSPSNGGLNVLKRRGGSSGGLFGSIWGKKDVGEAGVWPRASGSRPVSTYSTDNILPRPSADVLPPFGWNDSVAAGNTSRVDSIAGYPWSSIPSRRTSVNHEASLSVPSNLQELEMDSSEIRDDDDIPNTMAPIGTKPSKMVVNSLIDSSPARLNPNARDFRSLLNFTGGSEKKDKGKKKAIITTTDDESDSHDHTFATPERVKENRLSLPREHGELTAGEESATDGSPAKSIDTPSSTGRESFMRKMTRKGSSSKFGLPGSLFSRKSTNVVPTLNSEDIMLEDPDYARLDSSASAAIKDLASTGKDREGIAGSVGMGRSLESVLSVSSSTKSSGFGSLVGFGKRRAKKDKLKEERGSSSGGGGADGGAPSISEASLASTETDRGESEDELGSLSLVGRMSADTGL